MPGLPEITAVGTLTADVELRFTQGGHAVASFTVACNDRKFDKDTGKWTDGDATFLRCSVWRQAAENAAESLTKGDRLIVTGQLKQRKYTPRDGGEERTVFELDVAEIGVSIKFGPVKSQRAERSGGGQSAPASDDPWGSAVPATAGHGADEPPF
jgi:single-strand DNA-binding protein